MKSMKFVSEYSDVPFEIDLFNDNEYVKNLLNLDYDTDYIDTGVSYCKVEWEFTIETREWGVKTLSAYATNVSLEVNCEWYDEDDNDYEKQLDIAEQHGGFMTEKRHQRMIDDYHRELYAQHQIDNIKKHELEDEFEDYIDDEDKTIH